MEYKDLIRNAKKEGIASEKAMWESVDSINEMMCVIKDEHPDLYWKFMREQHEILYGPHYNKHFAEMDVEEIKYTNAAGEKKKGAYWSCEQIEEATKGLAFPSGTTKWDKYVAFNSFYADMCTVLEADMLIKASYKFYFADEDAPAGKIWEYMFAMDDN